MKKFAGILAVAVFICFAGNSALAADGAALYKRNCAGCHGMHGEKNTGGTQPLQGRNAASIQTMLLGYKAGSYGGAQKGMMQKIVAKLADDELQSIADYVGTLR